MREHVDNYDADLLLHLYEVRREPKLRQARDWFIRDFRAKNLDEYNKLCPPGSEPNALFRMTVSYWDMAASIVNRGLIKEDFFFENTAEFWIVWDKVRQLAPDVRKDRKNPLVWRNLEALAQKYEQWMAKQAPEALDSFRKRLQDAAGKKSMGFHEEK